MADAVDAAREQLIEAVGEADDDLMAKYLEGEELSPRKSSRRAAQGHRPAASPTRCSAGSAAKNIGVAPFLDALVADCPSPADVAPRTAHERRPATEHLKADAAGPLAALVFKTAADPFVGKLTYLRVFSGTLQRDSHVWNANHNADERVGQLIVLRGKTQDHVAAARRRRHRRGREARAHRDRRHALHEGTRS